MKIAAIIVAAGRGTRAGGPVPKQWQMLNGKSVASHALRSYADHPRISQTICVLHADDIACGLGADLSADIIPGGQTRAASVIAGLMAVSDATHVLIHDAARPLVPARLIDDVIKALETSDAAAPAVPVTDALWRGEAGTVSDTVDRTGLWRAQTPQGFRLDQLLAAHHAYKGAPADDVTVARAAGMTVTITQGDVDNLKITGPDDLARAEKIMRGQMDIRLGNGFDVHAFCPGDHLWLCGVHIPHERGLRGHSDADVGMHAITDAIYGALAMGDIGQHFPPSDPKWKDAQSHIFLEHARELAHEHGFEINNIDCTLICEFPKIGPHAENMRRAIAQIIGCDMARVSIKATTSERLGFTGRGEGIAASATVSLVKI